MKREEIYYKLVLILMSIMVLSILVIFLWTLIDIEGIRQNKDIVMNFLLLMLFCVGVVPGILFIINYIKKKASNKSKAKSEDQE